MAVTVKTFLDKARSQIGYVESPGNVTKYGKWYGADGNPWCDMFVSWVGAQVGAGATVGKAAFTPAHVAWFKARGRWGYTPKPGAIVFFQWPGMGRVAHVGIVEAVRPDGSIVTIEGNTDEAGGRTGGKVMRKVRRANIAGYGYPDLSSVTSSPLKRPVKTPPRPVTKMGAKGQAVKNIQNALVKHGLMTSKQVDGDFGPGTQRAVIALQKKFKLPATGVVNAATWKALAS